MPKLPGNKNRNLRKQVHNAINRRVISSDEDETNLANLGSRKEELLETIRRTKAQLKMYHEDNHLEGEIEEQNELQQNEQQPNKEKDATKEDAQNDEQLYGKDHEEKMIHLSNGIYCRKIIHDMAVGSSQQASHVARKLLEGVFKFEFLLKATLTGQAPRAQGTVRQTEPVFCLNIVARKVITDFATNIAAERGWPPMSVEKVERAMSQRIGELKRLHRKK